MSRVREAIAQVLLTTLEDEDAVQEVAQRIQEAVEEAAARGESVHAAHQAYGAAFQEGLEIPQMYEVAIRTAIRS